MAKEAFHPGRAVQIRAGPVELRGDLTIPEGATGIVLFAHGSGSGRMSPRNRYVADVLHQGGLATLLMDLLTVSEEQADADTGHLRFDISLLAQRLVAATNWLQDMPVLHQPKIGYFGSSTGGGAALVAAAQKPAEVRAVVSRGGRPDLAGAALSQVSAPTLLIVGARDVSVIELNEAARKQLRSVTHLEIIPGATHLFEEPGTLEKVAALARDWFRTYL